MIDFRDRESFAPNLVMIASVIALAGGLVLQLLPPPSDPGLYSRTRNQKTDALLNKKKIDELLVTTEQGVDKLTWTGLTQDVNSSILIKLNALIKKHGLKLGSIRPQRSNTVDAINTIPYLVIVEGPFPKVLSFAREIEKPVNKMAVNSFQCTSADTNSDRVTGTITAVAYLNPKPPIVPAREKDVKSDKEANPTRA